MTEFADDVPAEERMTEMEHGLLHGLLGCRTTEAVEAAVTYAAFLSSVGIAPDNYPIFLRVLQVENHWVIDALMGERDPFLFLSPIQPDHELVMQLFSMLTRWHHGTIYQKNLLAILGVLQVVYTSPQTGYAIYPTSIRDLNALGKHLDRDAGQDDRVNRAILEILDHISDLEDTKNPDMEEAAAHANAIRNVFFDSKKQLEDVIPPVLLAKVEARNEIPPRKRGPVVEKVGKPVAVVLIEEPKAEEPKAKTSPRKTDD
jgi:hypothetical protein